MAKKNKLKKLKKSERRMYEAACAAMANGSNGKYGANGGILRGLNNWLPSRKSERFLLGVLVGAGAAYVLSDENLRGKIIKSAMKLYSGVAGELEEIKEQIADYKAEIEAGQPDEA